MYGKYELGEKCPYGNCVNVVGFDFEQCPIYFSKSHSHEASVACVGVIG